MSNYSSGENAKNNGRRRRYQKFIRKAERMTDTGEERSKRSFKQVRRWRHATPHLNPIGYFEKKKSFASKLRNFVTS